MTLAPSGTAVPEPATIPEPTAAPEPPASPALSAVKIGAIAQAVHNHFTAKANTGGTPDSNGGQLSREQILDFLQTRQPLLASELYETIANRVLALATGLEPLQTLLEDDQITEIMINGPGAVLVERAGQIHPTEIILDAGSIAHLIERIVAPLGLHIDRRQPFGDARLPDGTRVNIVIPPLAIDGPYLTLRRFGSKRFSLEDFCGDSNNANCNSSSNHSSNHSTAETLRQLVRRKANIVVSGGTGSGKTSLLNALAEAIGSAERVVTIEDAAELRLASNHVVRLETRPANPDGIGAIDARTLLRNALRMRPDRIIIGEVRGSEVFEMLQAMNTGHEGSLSTCHANSVADTLQRLEMMALLYSQGLPLEAIREQLRATIDVVVHTQRQADGQRQIVEVAELNASLGVTEAEPAAAAAAPLSHAG